MEVAEISLNFDEVYHLAKYNRDKKFAYNKLLKSHYMYFFIQGTKTTPYAIINDGYMKITGKSTPVEEDNAFYGRINKQVNLYAEQPANKTFVDIALTHVNAASKRAIVDLLNSLEKLNQQGFQVVINWHFDPEDEDAKELGEIFDSMFEMDFIFKEAA